MKPKRQFTGIVNSGRLPTMERENLQALIRSMEGKRVRITVEEVKRRRSLSQNAFYHGAVIPVVKRMFIESGTDIDEEQTHEFLKQHVGGLKSVIADPSGVRRTVVGTTTKLTTMEFEDYLEKIRAWAAQFGHAIPYPHEIDGTMQPLSPNADESHGSRRPEPVSSPETEKAPAFFNNGANAYES